MEFVLALMVAIFGGALSASLPTLHKDVTIQQQAAPDNILLRPSHPANAVQQKQQNVNARDALVHSTDLLDVTVDALSNTKSSNDPQAETDEVTSNRKPSDDEENTEVERRGQSEAIVLLDESDSRVDSKVSAKVRRSVLDDVKQLLENKFSAILEDDVQRRPAKKGVSKKRTNPKIITKPPILIEKKKIKKVKNSPEYESNLIKILTDGSLQDSSDVALRNIVDHLLKEDEDHPAGSSNYENNRINGVSIEYNDIISELMHKNDQNSNNNNKAETSEIDSDTEEILNNLDLDKILSPVLNEMSDSVGQESVISSNTITKEKPKELNMNERHANKSHTDSESDQREVQNNEFNDVEGKVVHSIDTDEHTLHTETDNHDKSRNHHNNSDNISRHENLSSRSDISNHYHTPTKPKTSTHDHTHLKQPKLIVENHNKHNDGKGVNIKVQPEALTPQDNNKHTDTIHKKNTMILKTTDIKPKATNDITTTGQESNDTNDNENGTKVSTDKNTNSSIEETITTEGDVDNFTADTRRSNNKENNATDIDETEDEVNISDEETTSPNEENVTIDNSKVTHARNHGDIIESKTLIAPTEKQTNNMSGNSNSDDENVNDEENTTRDESDHPTDVDTEDQLDTAENERNYNQKLEKQKEKIEQVGSSSLHELLDNEDIVQSYTFSITFTPK